MELHSYLVQIEYFRNNARAALQKGIKDNSVFQKFNRTIPTKRTCVTQVKEMHGSEEMYITT
jgi:hypothetical protein